ncbi:BZ3500_MvSof-1268-A1-R1_Chr1-3g02487 [Microbotryum saponariae]|uniref:protein O-GlcNAc transferase n=1 Tax=Microbotryum saponariae TaxID=289078 RepID=A0A2X0MVX3_9BASI|nr:BZ3500_MvSof-1268-A1-R1_Chr1-3g02487 [Microbotryum saponariae]SCZ96375.1 BZ3501_MvSof-1269-A2-R1_Chr1-3g02090 [Microbotryum saponariae]
MSDSHVDARGAPASHHQTPAIGVGVGLATASTSEIPVRAVTNSSETTTAGPEIEMSSSSLPSTSALQALPPSPPLASSGAPQKPADGTPSQLHSTTGPQQSQQLRPPRLDLAGARAVPASRSLTSQIPFDLPSASSPDLSPTYLRSHYSSSTHFPILPASQPVPNQVVQTAVQVASILSLPAPLLLTLARTNSPTEQRKIATRMDAASYLSSMALPPPSPSALVPDLEGSELFGPNAPISGSEPTSGANGVGNEANGHGSSTKSSPNAEIPGRRPSLPFTSIGDHPALPLLLGQVFSPPTPGIVAPSTPASEGPLGWLSKKPIFSSIEDWSYQAARERVAQVKRASTTPSSASGSSSSTAQPRMVPLPSFSEREISTIAKRMARWALKEQVDQVGQQVEANKEKAVLLAAEAAARSSSASGACPTSIPTSTSGTKDTTNIDLSAYAATYKRQLDALASGYFAQLHREAVKRLANAAQSPVAQYATSSGPDLAQQAASASTSSAIAPTDFSLNGLAQITGGTEQAQAIHVQAAAAAAIAANSLAAKEMASVAGTALENLGVDVPQHIQDRSHVGGLDLLELRPETIAAPPTSTTITTAPSEPGATTSAAESTVSLSSAAAPISQASAAVSTILEQVNLGGEFTPEKRDYFLSYAHSLYAKDPYSSDLLPLLHTLEEIHPDHLPTLLLSSCVYYTRGEYESSLYYNKKLLMKDPGYVEAMSNIGTTLRAMGRWQEAEAWWWKAIKLRPTYWDATENLLGVLCNPVSTSQQGQNGGSDGAPAPATEPRYQQALELCNFVEVQIFASESGLSIGFEPSRDKIATYASPEGKLERPRRLPQSIPMNQVHRLQNLLYAKGNLRLAVQNAAAAQEEYEKAIELALSLPASIRASQTTIYPVGGCSTRDLVVAAFIMAKVLNTHAQFNGNSSDSRQAVGDVLHKLGVADEHGRMNFAHLIGIVQRGGDHYVEGLLRLGGGVLPAILVTPEQTFRMLPYIFAEFQGVLPSMREADGVDDPSKATTIQQVKQTTSTMILTLAKVFQDSAAQSGPANKLTLGGVPCSPSLLLPMYYLALALHPSPSTCNNLGILLSTVNATAIVAPAQLGLPPTSPRSVLSGQDFALRYYNAGLKLDTKHPHLYTNLGSLLKDMGNLPEAIRHYKKAVECNPKFDVALANLANAIKDSGQIQESIPYYKRAVELNPNFPEAICGLVNALGGVCDWAGRGGVNEEWIVDNETRFAPAPPAKAGAFGSSSGYMGQISALVGSQLADGMGYGAGSLRAVGDLDHWLRIISQAIYGLTPEQVGEAMSTWKFRLEFLLNPKNRKAYPHNEGGYLIRLVERLMRRIQRRWYISTYGPNIAAAPTALRIMPTPEDLVSYRRPMLPPVLPPVGVPTVLPFHCFTLPVSAREIRLISHRTGLSISRATLNQPWMPDFVLPPPRPPIQGVLNIGYVSSDLGNHPLSHLMQSVFGFHDTTCFNIFVYATSASDRSPYRLKIEAESQNFYDVSARSTQEIVDQIVRDEIHVLINLSGYTKGARNEIFAARPAPVQMSYMGFAGTLAAGWCDYFIVDPIVCPPGLVSGDYWRARAGLKDASPEVQGVDTPTDFEGDPDPEAMTEDYVYTEKLLYLPHSYFVTDHKQAWREDETAGLTAGEPHFVHSGMPNELYAIEEARRWQMRRELFPGIRDDTFIFANWNQLYKIDPFIFRIWLNILAKFPNSILWLLRFPAPGEAHLKSTALKWAGPEVAARIVFTDVANKVRSSILEVFVLHTHRSPVFSQNEHVRRGRVADLFLDTTEVRETDSTTSSDFADFGAYFFSGDAMQCNAHTTAADILWSGTPLLTYPRHAHKMASRVAASIAVATGLGPRMIVSSAEEYEERALQLASTLTYDHILPDPAAPAQSIYSRQQRIGRGELADMRKTLYLTRETSPLFDTRRWVRNMEAGVFEAWKRWVNGTEFEDAGEWGTGVERESGSIWVVDAFDGTNLPSRAPYSK